MFSHVNVKMAYFVENLTGRAEIGNSYLSTLCTAMVNVMQIGKQQLFNRFQLFKHAPNAIHNFF